MMALLTCPDCQASVSDAAPACPKCGRPIAATAPNAPATSPQVVVAKRAGAPWEASGFVMILAGMGIAFASCGAGAVVGLLGLGVFMVGRFMD